MLQTTASLPALANYFFILMYGGPLKIAFNAIHTARQVCKLMNGENLGPNHIESGCFQINSKRWRAIWRRMTSL